MNENIKIANVRTNKYEEGWYEFYCGRPTPLGNPFEIGVDGDRNEVVAKYAARGITDGMKAALEKIQKVLDEGGKVKLLCYCSPKLCHCDIIKGWLG